MKHTPGPWKARDYKNSDGDIWIDCAAYKGETPLGGTLAIALHTGRGKGEMNDNARLIAAAPELLAKARADLAAFERIVELTTEVKQGLIRPEKALDLIRKLSDAPALADVVKALDA